MRENSSSGPLAMGFSMPPFSHVRRSLVESKLLPFMSTDTFEQLLDRAASWYGIDDGFWDIFGNHHTTSVAAKQSILRALGVAVDSAEDLEWSLASLARHEWERLLPPAVVASTGAPVELIVNVAAESLG